MHHHKLELDLLEASLLASETIREDLIFQESLHFDIHNEQQVQYTPNRNRSINDFDDRTAMGWLGWNVYQFLLIARQFNMDKGTISLLQRYLFSKEEFFLFVSTKINTGMDNQRLCDLCFGGCSRRWSAAIKWYVKYLEVRYRDILNVVGLDREKENTDQGVAVLLANTFELQNFSDTLQMRPEQSRQRSFKSLSLNEISVMLLCASA
mgnify:CR=1 FL=1